MGGGGGAGGGLGAGDAGLMILGLLLGGLALRRRRALLVAAVLLLPVTSFGADALVLSEDVPAAEALLKRKLKDEAPPVQPLPEANRLAGAWILGAAPESLCPTPSVPAEEVTATLTRAQELLDELEVEQGFNKLMGIRPQLGCLVDPVDTDSLYALHFLEAVAATYSNAKPEAAASLRRALAIRPGQAFDESYPPEMREAYLAEQQQILQAGRAHVVAGAADLAWLDGVPLAPGTTPTSPGEHLLQVRGGDGQLRGGLIRLAPGGIAAVGQDGGLMALIDGLDASRRAELGAALGEGEVWVADGERIVALVGTVPGGGGGGLAGGGDGAAPLLLIAAGGGWQLAGRGAGHHYGALAIDVGVRLTGPLRLDVHLRPSLGAPVTYADGSSWAPLLFAFGAGPVILLDGPVRPRFGVALQVAVDRAPGADAVRPLLGVFGTAGLDIPLGASPVALRPSFEGGFLGRNATVRGLVQVAVGVR